MLAVLFVLFVLLAFRLFFKYKRDRETALIAKEKEAVEKRRREKRAFERLLQLEKVFQRKREKVQQEVLEDPPEIVTLSHLLEAYKRHPEDSSALIEMALIYRRGSYPRFRPNPNIAMELLKCAAGGFDEATVKQAMTLYTETRLEPVPERDQAGIDFPEHFGRTAVHISQQYLMDHKFQSYRMTRDKAPAAEENNRPREEHGAAHNHTRLMVEDMELLRGRRNVIFAAHPRPPPPTVHIIHPPAHHRPVHHGNEEGEDQAPPAPWNDPQNTHDHVVARSVAKIVQTIQSQQPADQKAIGVDKDKLLQEIGARAIAANKEMSNAQKSDAWAVLRQALADERDASVLNSVWKHIEKHGDDEKENVIETLGKQLATGVSNGNVVCSSGRVGRIVASMEGSKLAEDFPKLRTTFALDEEILQLASKVRDDVLNAATEENREAYNSGTATDLEDEMKRQLRSKANEIYIKDLGVNMKILEPILSNAEQAF